MVLIKLLRWRLLGKEKNTKSGRWGGLSWMFNVEIRLSGTVGQLKASPNILNNDTLPFIGLGITKILQGINDSNLLTKP